MKFSNREAILCRDGLDIRPFLYLVSGLISNPDICPDKCPYIHYPAGYKIQYHVENKVQHLTYRISAIWLDKYPYIRYLAGY